MSVETNPQAVTGHTAPPCNSLIFNYSTSCSLWCQILGVTLSKHGWYHQYNTQDLECYSQLQIDIKCMNTLS